MAITAAQIEANGYVLALTISGTNSTASGVNYDSDYPLTPSVTPKLTLTSTHAGFDLSGGVAVANSARARSFIATKLMRVALPPTNAGVLQPKLPNETVASAGSFVVRIALSDWIYATDNAVTLTALAGWRTGEAAAGPIAVTNNSTVACPAPISRWGDVPYLLKRGTFDVEVLVFGFCPQGNQPVAAVKYLVTDGTTVKTYWSTALSPSTQYGDGLHCHRVTVDPSVATALTKGILRIDRVVYPFIGSAWTTDPAGTQSMSTMSTDAFKGAAQAPFAVTYDPTGSRYPFNCVYVDYTNGTVTASAGMVGTGSSEAAALTAAKAVTATARAKDVTTAVQALYLANLSFGTANGQASQVRIIDGQRIVLAPQTHANGMGTTAVTYLPTSLESWLRIEGDPADANPRQNVILRTANNGGPDLRTTRVLMSNMSVELGYYLYQWAPYNAYDNIEFRNATAFGLTGGATPIGGTVAPAGYLGMHVTRSRIWKSGLSFDNTFGQRCKILRKSEHRRAGESSTYVTNRLISEIEDNSFTGALGIKIAGSLASFTHDLSVYDSIFAFNDLRACKERSWNSGTVAAANTANPVYAVAQHRRQVVFGNIMERIGSSVDCMFNCGEQEQADMVEMIFEANTVVGDRINLGYNDASPGASVSATDSQQQNSYVNVRFANNLVAACFSKHDRFDDPAVKAQRVAAGDVRVHGIRPYNIQTYGSLFGVGHSDNVILTETFLGATLETFRKEFEGLRCFFTNTPTDPKFTNDQSSCRLGVDHRADVNPVGQGDYTPLAGSPAIAHSFGGNSDVDFTGAALVAPYNTGALASAVVALLRRSMMLIGVG